LVDFIFGGNIFKKIIYRVAYNSFHMLIHLFITKFLFYLKIKNFLFQIELFSILKKKCYATQ